MNPNERLRISRHAEHGDEAAQRLLDLVTAMEQAIALTAGVSQARSAVGEHSDVYGEAIDEMLSVLVPAILAAIDVRDVAELEDALGCYLPQTKEGEQ